VAFRPEDGAAVQLLAYAEGAAGQELFLRRREQGDYAVLYRTKNNKMRFQNRLIYLTLSILMICCQNEQQLGYPEYYRNFNQIDEYLESGQINIAISKFDSISTKIPHIPSSHLFKMARICAEHNLCELSAKYLKKSLQNGREYGKGTGAYKTIEDCIPELSEVLEQESEIHKQYFDFNYKALIDSMFQADQKARGGSDYEAMGLIDSLNMITLLSQIEKKGYPGEKLIGHTSAINAFIIILHMDRDRNNEIFKPILDEAYNNGQLWPTGYAWIVDRRRAWGDDQLEPYYYHMPSKEYEKFDLQRINEINRRRDSIGLAPK
jgi:hypothetical protein